MMYYFKGIFKYYIYLLRLPSAKYSFYWGKELNIIVKGPIVVHRTTFADKNSGTCRVTLS